MTDTVSFDTKAGSFQFKMKDMTSTGKFDTESIENLARKMSRFIDKGIKDKSIFDIDTMRVFDKRIEFMDKKGNLLKTIN